MDESKLVLGRWYFFKGERMKYFCRDSVPACDMTNFQPPEPGFVFENDKGDLITLEGSDLENLKKVRKD